MICSQSQFLQGQSTVWFVLLVSSSVLSSSVFSPLRIAYIFWLVNATITLGERGGRKVVERQFLRFSLILRRSMRLFTRGLNLAARYAWSLWPVDPSRRGEHWLVLALSLILYENKGSYAEVLFCRDHELWVIPRLSFLSMLCNSSIYTIRTHAL